MEDETLLRLFPVLRRAWSEQGVQAKVAITGRNAKRVLFGTIDLHRGHRIVMTRPNMRQANFQDFLSLLRSRYRSRSIWMLLDKAPCHVAAKSRRLAEDLDIHLVWLPKQCSELNSMDQLWKELKREVSANYQFPSIDKHAQRAVDWVLSLTPKQALRKAAVLSKNFWLRSFL